MRDLFTEANVLAQERLELRGRWNDFAISYGKMLTMSSSVPIQSPKSARLLGSFIHFLIRIRSALYNDDESDEYDSPLRYHIKTYKDWTYFCVQRTEKKTASRRQSSGIVEFFQDLGFNNTQGFGLLVVFSVP